MDLEITSGPRYCTGVDSFGGCSGVFGAAPFPLLTTLKGLPKVIVGEAGVGLKTNFLEGGGGSLGRSTGIGRSN